MIIPDGNTPLQNADRLIKKYIFLFLLIALGGFLLFELDQFIPSALGAVVFYILFKPMMVRLVERYKMKKALVAIIIILISFFLVVVPVYFIVSLVINKVTNYINDPYYLQTFLDFAQAQLAKLPFEINVHEIVTNVSSWAGTFVSGLMKNALNLVTVLGMMYFMLYFMLAGYGRIENILSKHIPLDLKKQHILKEELKNMTISNAVGVPLIAVVQGILAWILYWIAGVEDPVFWAVMTGCASIIPVVGTGIIWIPIVVVLLGMQHYWQAIVIVLGTVVVMGNADNVIRLMIFKRFADVHPLVTILGVIFGLDLWGLPGLVFGPLLISYFLLLIGMFMAEYKPGSGLPDADGYVQLEPEGYYEEQENEKKDVKKGE